jgi:hypothetical protein
MNRVPSVFGATISVTADDGIAGISPLSTPRDTLIISLCYFKSNYILLNGPQQADGFSVTAKGAALAAQGIHFSSPFPSLFLIPTRLSSSLRPH